MVIVYSDKFLEHVQDPTHPESPRRLMAICNSLESNGLWKDVIAPIDATTKELEAVHKHDYLAFLDKFGERQLTPDTFVHKETFAIARLAAGGGIIAAEKAWEESRPSFALVRPPGHHSGPAYGMGFCYLNNIAIAAMHMLSKAKKIAIVDIDVHHGNGTQDTFYKNPNVLYISTHERYIFPGTGHPNETGEGDGEGFNVNIPMNAGAGDTSFEFANEKIVMPILREFKPEILMISIGTDSHYNDPLASLSLSSKGHAKTISDLLEFGKKQCQNRTAFYLEGGYDLETLSEIIAHTVGLFEGKKTPLVHNDVKDKNCMDKETLRSIIKIQKSYWKLD